MWSGEARRGEYSSPSVTSTSIFLEGGREGDRTGNGEWGERRRERTHIQRERELGWAPISTCRMSRREAWGLVVENHADLPQALQALPNRRRWKSFDSIGFLFFVRFRRFRYPFSISISDFEKETSVSFVRSAGRVETWRISWNVGYGFWDVTLSTDRRCGNLDVIHQGGE